MSHPTPAGQLGRNNVGGHAIVSSVAGVRLPRSCRRETPAESSGEIDLYIARGLWHAGS